METKTARLSFPPAVENIPKGGERGGGGGRIRPGPSLSAEVPASDARAERTYLDGCGGAALKLDEDVGRVDGLRGVGILQLQDGLVHVARAGRVDANWLVGAAGAHEPAGDVQVVDGWVFFTIFYLGWGGS